MAWKLIHRYTGDFDCYDGVVIFGGKEVALRVENEKKNRHLLIRLSPEEAREYGQYLIKAAEKAEWVGARREERRRKRRGVEE